MWAQKGGQQMRVKLRFEFGADLLLGPGKAELLEKIAELGSIAAAGRAMGMSYKRAWSLVEEMNAALVEPVILSVRGGAGHGGATLTPTGRAVITHFRALEARLATPEASADLAALTALMRPGLGAGKPD
jgi:molybdate transport system regulatory protein